MDEHSQYKLTKEEIETDITIDYVDKTAFIYTCDARTKRKILKLLKDYPEQVALSKQDIYSVSVTVPASWIKIKPTSKRQNVTQEEREKMIERMRIINAARFDRGDVVS